MTKQILTVSLDQHWRIVPLSCAMLPSGLRPSGSITQLRGKIFQCLPRHQSIFVYLYISRDAYHDPVFSIVI